MDGRVAVLPMDREALLHQALGERMLAFDTETHLIRTGSQAPPFVCASYARRLPTGDLESGVVGQGQHYSSLLFRDQDIEEWLAEEVLENECIVGHNIAYDMAVIMAMFPSLVDRVWRAYEEDRVRDTLIRAKLLAILDGTIQQRNKGYSLADLYARGGLGVLEKGDWRLRYSELDGTPLEEWPHGAIAYAEMDAIATWLVFDQMPSELPDEWLQVRGAWALRLVTCRGIETDSIRVKKLGEQLLRDLRPLEEKLQLGGLLRSTTGSIDTGAVRKRVTVCSQVKGVSPPLTEKGNVKTDGQTLLDSGDPLLVSLAQRESIQKIATTFLPTLLPLIHCSFDSLVATGRTSCYRPNLQQVPKKFGVRECFRAREGYLFLRSDVSRAEMCAIAEYCFVVYGYSELKRVLEEGIDPHTLVAVQLLGLDYSQYKEDNAAHKQARALGKIANFGAWGGMGFKAFRSHVKKQGITITEAESKEVLEAMARSYPEKRIFSEEVSSLGEPHVQEQLYSGRKRGFLRYTSGCNTRFQGLVGDASKETTYNLVWECWQGSMRGCYLINQIHDEWLTEAPKGCVEEMLGKQTAIIQRTFQKWIPHVPIEVDSRISKYWGEE